MSKVMKLNNLKNRPSRNGFDLSRRNAFTAKTGEILPIAVIPVIPDDKFKINLSSFTRTMPVETAAFTRIREYFDAFFVPYDLIWKHFNTLITEQSDNVQYSASLEVNNVAPESTPFFTTASVAGYMGVLSAASTPSGSKTNAFGFKRSECTSKLLEYLGYGDNFNQYAVDSVNNWDDNPRFNEKLSPFALMAYQKIYQDHFRFAQWEKYDAKTCNLDFVNINGPSNQGNLDLSSDLISETFAQQDYNMFDLRYCNFERDLYFGLLPNSQYGAEAVVPLTRFATDRVTDNGHYLEAVGVQNEVMRFVDGVNLGDGKFVYKAGRDVNTQANLSIPEGLVNKINAYVNDLSILTLRATEQLQRWKEIAQSGNQDYKSQIEKFWGCHVPTTMSNLCYNLGGVVGNVDISEVVNSNFGTDDAQAATAQADIKGVGRGSGQGYINFDNNNFGNRYGMIIITYHNRPLLDYDLNRASFYNKQLFPHDFAHPMFDRIGMEQLHLLDVINTPSMYEQLHNSPIENLFLGYAPRYINYKTAVDEIHGGFKLDEFHQWTSPVNSAYFESFIQQIGGQGNIKYDYHVFKVNPHILDPIFLLEADSTCSTDQFLINCAMDIKCVRNLDYNGMPY